MILHTSAVVTFDVGALPVYEARIVLPCLGCTPAAVTVAWLSGAIPPGKDADEIEMDSVKVTLVPGTDQATLILRGLEGYIHDKFIVCCCIG